MPVNRQADISCKNLHEQDLAELADLCATVARNPSADSEQARKARALRIEWVTLHFDGLPHNDKTEAEEALKKRMIGFLGGLPGWMLAGL
jgi:hypothetical protein